MEKLNAVLLILVNKWETQVGGKGKKRKKNWRKKGNRDKGY